MYKELLNDVMKILEKKHIDLYFNITKEKINNYIEEVLNKYSLNDKYDFYYISNVIMKKIFGIYDSHTKLIWKESNNLPIRLKYIDNKLYIIRTDKNNEDLLYSEILKINNVEVSKLIDEIKDMTAYSTEEYLCMPIEVVLRTIEKLKSLPSINNNCDEFEYEVLKDNQIIKRKLSVQQEDLIDINKWKKNCSYQVINDKIYIVYNACKEEYKGQMKELVDKVSEIANTNNINKFIIDIRGNTGGNSNTINVLIDYLKDKEVITLIDEYVFSGGRWAIFDLKNINSKFIGTGIGTSMNCFGNAPRNEIDEFILPVSNRYFYFDKDCNMDKYRYSVKNEYIDKNYLDEKYFISFEEMKKNETYFIPQIFEPDYYVKNSIEDYKIEYDRQLESALMLIDLENENTNEEFLKVSNPNELMNFMDKYITYGYVDINNKNHLNNLDGLNTIYKTSSVDEILDHGLATCIGQAKLIKYYFDSKNIENKLYCIKKYDERTNKINMHCFVLYNENEKWYHFEHSMSGLKGNHEYSDLDSALKNIASKWDSDYSLKEIDSIPDNILYKEFNQYVDEFGIKNKKDK